jgi:hypothetical protein
MSDQQRLDGTDARPVYRSTAGWAVSVLRDLGAIREQRGTGEILLVDDVEAWEGARLFALNNPMRGSSTETCLAAIDDVRAFVEPHQAH